MDDKCPDCVQYEQQIMQLEHKLDDAVSDLAYAQDKLNDITDLVIDLYRLVK